MNIELEEAKTIVSLWNLCVWEGLGADGDMELIKRIVEEWPEGWVEKRYEDSEHLLHYWNGIYFGDPDIEALEELGWTPPY